MLALSSLGAQAIYILDHPRLDEYHAETYASAFAQAMDNFKPTLLLASSSPQTLDFFPRLAARLAAPILTGCTQVSDHNGCIEFTLPAYAGMASAILTCSAPPPYLATLLPASAGMPALIPAVPPEVIHFSPRLDDVQILTQRLSQTLGNPTNIDLAEADVIVAGGRGAGEAQDWLLLERLARALGGALGGTRPALDAGYIQRSRMIGQTGKNVRPRLYLAAGISGSTYHLRGVNAEHLLAINYAADAPIFKSCQCGVSGDLRLVIPELLKHFDESHASQEQETP
jgi:electron transfer flavoprotein alpha subunit